MFNPQKKNLYLISGEQYSFGRTTLEVAQVALPAGVDVFQMREKNKSYAELLLLGQVLKLLCQKQKVTFIVNDNPILAQTIGADGVHLGQEDLQKYPLLQVRKFLGKEKIIGVSTHSLEQFLLANQADFDYIAFGPIFPTQTKDYTIGTAEISQVLAIAQKPVFFIGGINLKNISQIINLGGKNIAVIRAITEAQDLAQTIQKFKQVLAYDR